MPPTPNVSEGSATRTPVENVFREHHRLVFATAFRLTGSAQDAEDVIQTVFLRLLRRDTLDLAPNPGAYLRRAAINAGLDLLRARSRARSIPLDEIEPVSSEHSPERNQRDRELRRDLRRAIARLPSRNAEIFSMRFLEETPNREIAEVLGMSAAAVGVAVHRARKNVIKELQALSGGN